MVAQTKELYGPKTKAAAVRAAVEGAVKSGELDFSEIVEETKVPDSAKDTKAA